MIGQRNLLKLINTMINENTFPRFSVIQGVDGSGKNLIVQHISIYMNYGLIEMDNTVDSVRSAMEQAYRTTVPIIFYFRNADTMSQSARNALLKVTEEPPNNAYFILTVVNLDSLTDTIRSRANVFYMEPYTHYELNEYLAPYDDGFDKKLALEVCETPGDIDLLYKNGAEKLYNFVEKVMDNIAEVSVANALKIANSIAFSETDENKFDLALFWKVVIMYYCNEFTADVKNMSVEELRTKARIVMSTKECIDMITKTRGINKRNVFDIWILDVRDILGEEYGSN